MFGDLDRSFFLGINPTIYTPEECQKRREQKNAFVTKLLAHPKLWLFGSETSLRK